MASGPRRAARTSSSCARRRSSSGCTSSRPGSEDGQQPHDEDEIYVVLSGRGRFVVDGDDLAVGPGSILFVEKHAVHRFHSIEEDLSIVVAFSPPRPR